MAVDKAILTIYSKTLKYNANIYHDENILYPPDEETVLVYLSWKEILKKSAFSRQRDNDNVGILDKFRKIAIQFNVSDGKSKIMRMI